MELIEISVEKQTETDQVSSSKAFIEANTLECQFEEIKKEHIIPVFIKDNEPLISHSEFVEVVAAEVGNFYSGEMILKPAIRVSHPIKGRIPEAKDKPASQLLDHEKTLYYDRMAFIIEIPTVSAMVDGSQLSLMVGGIKAFNLDNFYNKKGVDEHFKLFVGFKNQVCTNLCIWTDGFVKDVRVSTPGQLKAVMRTLLSNYNSSYHLMHLEELSKHNLTEPQFAHLVGRCRIYGHLPKTKQNDIFPLQFSDTQMGAVTRDYYKDESFCRMEDGTINLWRVYNLLTSANKSSYIDQFADRSVNAFSFCYQIKQALKGEEFCWFLN